MTAALEGGEWSAARPGRTLPPGKTRYPLCRRLGGPHGRSGRAEYLVPHRDSIPDRPARSQLLYRLSYPAHMGFRTVLLLCTYMPSWIEGRRFCNYRLTVTTVRRAKGIATIESYSDVQLVLATDRDMIPARNATTSCSSCSLPHSQHTFPHRVRRPPLRGNHLVCHINWYILIFSEIYSIVYSN